MDDRRSRRWYGGILVVALAPNVAVVLLGWCVAQVFFNALLAAQVAVLPDQVPVAQRGTVAGVLGVCLPLASVGGTYVVNVFSGNELAMFMVPCAIGGVFVVVFALALDDRRLAPTERAPWSFRRTLAAFYVDPRRHPDFMWAFVSRFLFVLAYALLVTYQAYYLLDQLGSAEGDVPQQIFLGTLAQASVVVVASVVGGRLSDRTGRRKVFVVAAAFVYGVALFVVGPRPTWAGSWSAWPSAAWASACTWPSTSHSSPTCCPTRTRWPRTWAC